MASGRNAAQKAQKRLIKRINKRKKRKREEISDGISIYISPVTFVMAVFFVAFGMAYEFACSITAVVLHEFAHATVAKKLGYALNEIKLMPYGAALCGNAAIAPGHEILIAIAGPVYNLLIALIFAAMWWLIPASYAFTQVFCVCNIYIGLFNLLPVYPLDGGRIALALMSFRINRRKAYLVIRIISAVIGLAAIALFVLSAFYAFNLCFLSVGLFMTASAFIPDNRVRYYALFAFGGRKERLSNPIEVKVYAVSVHARLSRLFFSLDPERLCGFDVYDDRLERVASVSEGELVGLINACGYNATLETALNIQKSQIEYTKSQTP